MRIFVKLMHGRIITLLVEASDKIAVLKARIQDKEGIPIARQQLRFNGQPLEDSWGLSDYNIQNEFKVDLIQRFACSQRNSSIQLLPRTSIGALENFRIFVNTFGGRVFSLDFIQPSDTVAALKRRISGCEGIPPCRQHLVYNGKQLEDSCMLSAFNLCQDSILYLVVTKYTKLPDQSAEKDSESPLPDWTAFKNGKKRAIEVRGWNEQRKRRRQLEISSEIVDEVLAESLRFLHKSLEEQKAALECVEQIGSDSSLMLCIKSSCTQQKARKRRCEKVADLGDLGLRPKHPRETPGAQSPRGALWCRKQPSEGSDGHLARW